MATTLGRLRPRTSNGDAGFTLIELMVTMVIVGLLFALAAGGYRAYAASQAHRGTAEALVVLMREAHQRAVTEGVTYGVKFDAASSSWTMLKDSNVTCSSGTPNGGEVPSRGGVSYAASSLSCVYFKARGTAKEGTVKIQRGDNCYTVTVEGLTGRASVSSLKSCA